MLRSLGLKLTLAFLTVAILSVTLVAIVIGQRTMREFDQFVSDRFQHTLIEQLTDYYASNGSWRGLLDERDHVGDGGQRQSGKGQHVQPVHHARR